MNNGKITNSSNQAHSEVKTNIKMIINLSTEGILPFAFSL